LPRSTGELQKVGSGFLKDLREFDPIEPVKKLAQQSEVIVFKPLQDEVVGNEYFEEYKKISRLQYVEIDGDHSFKNPEDRMQVIKLIKDFL